jgi:uncharacterized protein YjbI with pentapeptide repeats
VPTQLAIALAAALIAAFVALAYRRRWHWTGLPATPAVSTGPEVRPAKTLWDWLQLLGVPVALASLAFLFTNAQSVRDRRRAADAERENTLRTYLAQMSDLMLDRKLLRSRPGADVRNVARTTTLTAVRRLDGARRGVVVRFLAEAHLLRQKDKGARVLVASANLAHADLAYASLSDVNLRAANLRGANLRGAYLGGATLGFASLRGANLTTAILRDADLSLADLGGADLGRADLGRANLVAASLRGANLRGADLRGADLRGAHLDGADLRGARGVDMTGAGGKPGHTP